MDPQISIEAEFKDGKLHTGLERAARAEERQENNWRKIARQANQAEREIERFAKRTNEINATPVERYLTAQVKLHDSLARGLMTQQQYNTALARAKAEYEALEDAANGAKEAEEGRASAAAEASRREQFAGRVRANSAKLEHEENLRLLKERQAAQAAAVAESNRQQEFATRLRSNSAKLEQQENLRILREKKEAAAQQIAMMRAVEQGHVLAHARMKSSQEDALGANFLGQIQSFVGGYLTLHAAVNLVADAFRNAKQESQEALASLRSLDDANRRLNQIAGSPAELEGMMQRADAAAQKYGVDRTVARDVLFQTYNQGTQDQYEQFMEASSLVAPGEGVRIGGKMRAMFGGQVSPMQALNMTIAAAKSSEMDVEQYASTVAIAGEGGRIAGARPDETLAAVSVLSSAFKSGQVGADRVRTFLTKSGLDKRFAGKGLLGSLDALQAMDKDERAEFLGRDMEMNVAYQSLTQYEEQIRAQQAVIAEAGRATGADTEVAKGIGRASQSGTMQTSLQARRAERILEVEKEAALASGAASSAAGTAAARSGALRVGGIARRYGTSLFAGAMEMIGAPAESTAMGGLLGGQVGAQTEASLPFVGPLIQMLAQIRGDGQAHTEATLEVLRDIRNNTTRNPSAQIQQRAAQRAQ